MGDSFTSRLSHLRNWVVLAIQVLATGTQTQLDFTDIIYHCQSHNRIQGRRRAVTGRGVVDSEALIGQFRTQGWRMQTEDLIGSSCEAI